MLLEAMNRVSGYPKDSHKAGVWTWSAYDRILPAGAGVAYRGKRLEAIGECPIALREYPETGTEETPS
jgi:hypothetical protein